MIAKLIVLLLLLPVGGNRLLSYSDGHKLSKALGIPIVVFVESEKFFQVRGAVCCVASRDDGFEMSGVIIVADWVNGKLVARRILPDSTSKEELGSIVSPKPSAKVCIPGVGCQ